ncbi:MAG: tetratricopeptide repeat protein [Pseudomonadota bacterium]
MRLFSFNLEFHPRDDLRGYSLVLLSILLLSACGTTPEKPEVEPYAVNINFVENESIDLAVRKDFVAATKLLNEKQYKPAIELLMKVIKGSQTNSAPYINIAIAYTMLDDMENAEENLKHAIEITPTHPVANNEYALILRKTGRYAEAKMLYEKLLTKYPGFMPARKNYGILCELYLNNPSCAYEQYEAYIEVFPKDEDVKLWLSGLKQKLGK